MYGHIIPTFEMERKPSAYVVRNKIGRPIAGLGVVFWLLNGSTGGDVHPMRSQAQI